MGGSSGGLGLSLGQIAQLQEKAKAIKELRQEVLDISMRVTEKVVGQIADPALQRRVVDKVFVELEAKKQA